MQNSLLGVVELFSINHESISQSFLSVLLYSIFFFISIFFKD
uniref:Uncharacterized protein n=1 Tax=Rhizophora mucronata TaxID=61149 RepID=A0A2P2Q8N2_RHIMU